jgi:hypothetical protein
MHWSRPATCTEQALRDHYCHTAETEIHTVLEVDGSNLLLVSPPDSGLALAGNGNITPDLK